MACHRAVVKTQHLDVAVTRTLKTELGDAAAVWVDGATNQDTAT